MRSYIRKILVQAGIKQPFEVVIPEKLEFGHYSTSVLLGIAKRTKKNPIDLGNDVVARIKTLAPPSLFEKIAVAPPGFINFWISKKAIQKEFEKIWQTGERHRESRSHKGKTVIVEYSQPNIAKRMHVGHLRTTIIGDALAHIYEACGYKVIRWNYIGDWGTQFGKLIVAYRLWGDKQAMRQEPIAELTRLYVKFHKEVKIRPELNIRGQEEFRKLEEGDRENRRLWNEFKKVSLKEFKLIYHELGIRFDSYVGESFFEREMKPLVALLKKKRLAEESQGALIVPLEDRGFPPALIQKTDHASLYLTRDIAALRYRVEKYKPEKLVYVVGNEQTLHFAQLFAVADMLGIKGTELVHAKYGLVLGETGKKLATREGRTVLLEDVLHKAVNLAREVVEKKNPTLSSKEKEKIAKAVGVGALKYHILKEHRHSDIVFDWKSMLDFSGDSGPYLQYTYARFASILKKSRGEVSPDFSFLESESELAIMRKTFEFPEIIRTSAERLLTNHLAKYLYELAVVANKFYETTPILKDENIKRRNARLGLIKALNLVLKKGLGLLGIVVTERI